MMVVTIVSLVMKQYCIANGMYRASCTEVIYAVIIVTVADWPCFRD